MTAANRYMITFFIGKRAFPLIGEIVSDSSPIFHHRILSFGWQRYANFWFCQQKRWRKNL